MAGLLISVRDALEAVIALEHGAAIIDVKEPTRGSLGRADDSVLAQVLAVVDGRRPVSAALGEWCDWATGAMPPFVERLTFVKWGMAGVAANWLVEWRTLRQRIEETPCRVVLSAYVDHRRASAPPVQEMCHVAIQERASVFLLDTAVKDGTTLVDWISVGELMNLAQRCLAGGVRLALAGGLSETAIQSLRGVQPDWFAVRGAACRGGREGMVDAERVRRLSAILRETDLAG